MPDIKGIKKVRQLLTAMGEKAQAADKVTVVVGFTQSYAVYVHENKQAAHPVGQAKYIEQPSRELKSKFSDIIQKVTKKTGNIRDGLLMAGLLLQRSAQKLTPVDTGALKASAFTDFQENVDEAARKAFDKSEQIRKAGKKKK
jgi:hypothetical protein|tara:strand:- start:6771 stop:7199 length:429 start_codon:yes stop_codon:yes gene_type:complete